MFKKIFAAFLMSLTFGAAYAADPQKEFSFSVKECETKEGENIKLSPSDVQKGIYVTAVGGWSDSYPKTADMLKEKLKEAGFKVVDSATDADYGIQIYGYGMDLEEVEAGVTVDRSGGRAAYIVGGAILSGGLSLVGEAFNTFSLEGKEYSYSISFRVVKNPVDKGNGRLKGSQSDDIVFSATSISNDDSVKRETAQYLAMLDRFIKDHVAVSAPAVAAQE